MQSTSCEMPGWMKHKMESRLPGEISITSDTQMTPPYGRKWGGTKEPLVEGERGEWKSCLKTQHSKNEVHGLQSHHLMANRWGNNGNSEKLYSFGLQNHCRWWLQPWNKKTLDLGKKSYDQPRQHMQKQKHYFANKGPSSQSCGFPVVMYGCESRTIKKAELWRIDAFELWC